MNNNSNITGIEPLLKLIALVLLVVGIALTLFPVLIFRLLDAVLPQPTLIVRWIGAMVAAFGLSALVASYKPLKFWPVFLAGFLAMLAILILTVLVHFAGRTPPGTFGWIVAVISLCGAVPYGIVLWRMAAAPAGGLSPTPLPADLNLDQYVTGEGRSLDSLSQESPVLLVLLRHLGCTFCRETLADVAGHRRDIESSGARIVFVHMGDDEKANYLFERYRLDDIPRISDPDAHLYRALGLSRASFMQVYGPGMWKYAIQSVLLDGHGMGQIVGDRFQMPGVFLIHQGSVVSGFRHERISDHPDYLSILRYAAPAPAEEMHY